MTFVEAVRVVRDEWGIDVIEVVRHTKTFKMTFKEFLMKCDCCGGNWGGMLLTGIKKLYPNVWDVIPDDMGIRVFTTLCVLLILLDVDFSEEEEQEDKAEVEFEPGRVYWNQMIANP